MSTFTLNLGVPSHAVEPALLAQRLPALAAALRGFVSATPIQTQVLSTASAVQVHAAQLGVQRDHVTLEALPLVCASHHKTLVAIAASLAAEFATPGLKFTAVNSGASQSLDSGFLGTLKLHLALPPTANFIGRDISKALPRTHDARVLRQFVNAAQMTLHQSPLSNCAANSLWCCNALPTDDLARTWLQGGLAAWWDALPNYDRSWGTALQTQASIDVSTAASIDASINAPTPSLSTANQLAIAYSDVTLSIALKRRAAWALWAKPLELATMLGA